ncbi:MAG: carbon starvation protein A [Halanaerobium sp.]|nr:carbon starvation protein A [Halanaerobium sp.]
MNSLLVAVIGFAAFYLAYRFYGKFLSQKIYSLDPEAVVPSHEMEDGIDFVPTNKHILFGHHFTSIAGAAPIVGPAIAVIWGWVPAVLWVVLGTIFMGAVHDFGALVISARHKGRSIGEITEDLVGPRARTLFLLFIFFTLLIVIAVFALVIAILFNTYPGSVFPIWLEIPLAMAVGYLVYKKKANLVITGLVALVIMYVSIYIGVYYLPFSMPAIFGNNIIPWVVILMIYAFFASILPVWLLLQARDNINSHELFVGLGLMFLGLLIARPTIVAPAFNSSPAGAPNIWPFLFITIACGAISGFHSLVSSGTSVKQLNNETDAKAVGYGGMIAEGVLALMAILACTAGFASTEAWTSHYASWSAASGLGAKVAAFVEGGASFLEALSIPHELGAGIIAVVVVSFAATTLDTATRLQRYVVSELAEDYNAKALAGRIPATLVAVISALLLASINGGKGGLILWPLFGAVNQLLAGLALLTISVYLYKQRKSIQYTIWPMIFMIIVTSWALVTNINNYYQAQNWLLTVLGGLMLLLEVWLILETIFAFRNVERPEIPTDANV